MNRFRHWSGRVIGALAGTLLLVAPALAADYPSHPVKIYVGFAAGGATDLVARLLAERLSPRLGQQVVVENRPGAGGVLANSVVAKAPADGYSLVMVSASHAINVSLRKSLPYDTVADFAPVATVAAITNVLVVNREVPAKSVAEFIALAKAKPGTLYFSSAGVGSSAHLANELFKSMAGIDIRHVPYKGTADAVRDLITGRVQCTVDSVSALLPYIRNGELRVLGVADRTPSPLLPGVPTIAESGLPGYEVNAWVGLLAPAHTPPDVVKRINAEVNAVLKEPDMQRRLQEMGSHSVSGTPEDFAALIKSDIAKFAGIIKSAGIEAQ
jgi:tripartite-type tricarboxylate transporter receptor subunit TctC